MFFSHDNKLQMQAGDRGVMSLAFCIGGPYGHAEAVRKRGQKIIRLSSLVLNHQVRMSCFVSPEDDHFSLQVVVHCAGEGSRQGRTALAQLRNLLNLPCIVAGCRCGLARGSLQVLYDSAGRAVPPLSSDSPYVRVDDETSRSACISRRKNTRS